MTDHQVSLITALTVYCLIHLMGSSTLTLKLQMLSGVSLEISLTDEDRNLNSKSTESISVSTMMSEIPYIKIGNPITIDQLFDATTDNMIYAEDNTDTVVSLNGTSATASHTMKLDIETSASMIFVNATIPTDYQSTPSSSYIEQGYILPYVNYDFTAFGGKSGTYYYSDLPPGTTQSSNQLI